MNGVTWGSKCVVKNRRRESLSVGDTRKVLNDLAKKLGGHIGGIRVE